MNGQDVTELEAPTLPLPVQIWEHAKEESLTRRELDVRQLLSQAAPTHDIARYLGISPRNVESHLGHVYGKLHVRGRMEAML